jgi:hypothetical protein
MKAIMNLLEPCHHILYYFMAGAPSGLNCCELFNGFFSEQKKTLICLREVLR